MRKILVCVVIALFAGIITPSGNNCRDEVKITENYGSECPYDHCSCYFVRYQTGGYGGQMLKIVRCSCCGREFIEE